MRLENFGRLLAALREERGLTQSEVADAMSQRIGEAISDKYISRIENGIRKKIPTAERLVALASIFKLIPAERKEFLAAANNVDTRYFVDRSRNPQDVLDHCKDILRKVQSPAFIIDQFFDVIAGNNAVVQFYALDKRNPSVYEWINQPHPINGVDLQCSPKFRQNLPITLRSHNEFILRTIMNFRIRSLQYRHWPNFEPMLERFKTYSDFRKFWGVIDEYSDIRIAGVPFTVPSKQWGELNVVASTLSYPTIDGQLEVGIYSPIDDHTAQAFIEMIEEHGNDVVQTAYLKSSPFD